MPVNVDLQAGIVEILAIRCTVLWLAGNSREAQVLLPRNGMVGGWFRSPILGGGADRCTPGRGHAIRHRAPSGRECLTSNVQGYPSVASVCKVPVWNPLSEEAGPWWLSGLTRLDAIRSRQAVERPRVCRPRLLDHVEKSCPCDTKSLVSSGLTGRRSAVSTV